MKSLLLATLALASLSTATPLLRKNTTSPSPSPSPYPNSTSPSPFPDAQLKIQTTSGLLTGSIPPSYPSVRQFLGIPYARPPTGPLRWEPPVRLSTPDLQRDVKVPGPACPQSPSNASPPSVFTVSAPEFLNPANWEEGCLSLSVWTPAGQGNGTGELLPVIIFIHGGGLNSGSASVPYQQPGAWVQRTGSHIVVAVQYRLGIFGFPNAGGLDRTNLGLLDQRMGIEWARDNVEAFGGDPERMVLWGQSSGAGSVDAQNFAYPEEPIVKGFISDSGSVFFPTGTGLTTEDPTHSNFSAVATGVGCARVNGTSFEEELECMRGKEAEELVDYIAKYAMAGTMPRLNFVATPDEVVVFSNYTARYEAGLLSDRPAIFGSNANEGVVMVPFPSPATAGLSNSTQTMADEFTYGIYQCPAYMSAMERKSAGRKTYQYLYAGNFSDVSPLYWEGAYHMSELPQIFGTRGEFRHAASEYEIRTSEAMQDLWLGFARDPENAEGAGWAEFGSGQLLILGQDGGYPVAKVQSSVVNAKCSMGSGSMMAWDSV